MVEYRTKSGWEKKNRKKKKAVGQGILLIIAILFEKRVCINTSKIHSLLDSYYKSHYMCFKLGKGTDSSSHQTIINSLVREYSWVKISLKNEVYNIVCFILYILFYSLNIIPSFIQQWLLGPFWKVRPLILYCVYFLWMDGAHIIGHSIAG